MAKVISLRVPEDLLEWADGYARSRNVSRTDLLVSGLRAFRDDCERGVPEIAVAAPAPSESRLSRAREVHAEAEAKAFGDMRAAHLARQRRLNEAAAARARPKGAKS